MARTLPDRGPPGHLGFAGATGGLPRHVDATGTGVR
jgi:hypothetical protein